MIKPRLQALVHLEDILNNDFLLFSYSPNTYPFSTTIKADFLISSHLDFTSYLFIIHPNLLDIAKCDYLCCSAFSKSTRDYEINQKPRKLLKKELIHIPTNQSFVLMDKINSSQWLFISIYLLLLPLSTD